MTPHDSRYPVTMVYGGTFDPVHGGHVAILKEVAKQLTPENIQIVLSARPPHRDQPAATIADRIAMLEQAFSDLPGVDIDTAEADRPGPSYTVWTLREMKQRFPGTGLVMLVGADALAGMASWYHSWEILSLCHLLVYARPGYDADVPPVMRNCLVDEPRLLGLRQAGSVCVLEAPQHNVAASELRTLLEGSMRDSAIESDALPPGVGDYISKHNIYTGASGQVNNIQENK